MRSGTGVGLLTRMALCLALGSCVWACGWMCGCKKGSAALTLPASNEVAGWEKAGETRTYTAANLSDYIDGGAEQYLKAGFKSLSTADYKYQGKIDAVTDVYTMADENAARAIFEADPAGDAKIIALGSAARVFHQSVIFRHGPYLVRVVAYQDTAQTGAALTALAQGVEKRLTQ